MRLPLAVTFVLAALSAGGCAHRSGDTIWLTRRGAGAADSEVFRWDVRRVVFTANPRGQYELLAEAPPADSDRPIRQALFVRVLWDIRPALTGTDETAMNAQIGYLIQTDPGGPEARTLYYEGMGNVLTSRPDWSWWGGSGRVKFAVRHAMLRLAQADRPRPFDPFGVVELEGTASAGADPEAAESIERIKGVIESLVAVEGPPEAAPPAPSGPSLPPPPPLPPPDLPLPDLPDPLPPFDGQDSE